MASTLTVALTALLLTLLTSFCYSENSKKNSVDDTGPHSHIGPHTNVLRTGSQLFFGKKEANSFISTDPTATTPTVDTSDDLEEEDKPKRKRIKRWGRFRFRVRLPRIRIPNPFKRRRSRENSNEAAKRRHAAQVAATCLANCWSQWSAFSACTVRCGSSGIKTRTRKENIPGTCVNWRRTHICPGPAADNVPCGRSCNNGGHLRPRDCACPSAWKGTCCEARVTCGYPGKPNNGRVTPGGSSHFYAAKVTFGCNAGYTLQGPTTRTCVTTGWSDSIPKCNIVSCGNPGLVGNGRRSGTVFTYGRQVVYECNRGFRLAGTKTRTCQANGRWSGATSSCQVIQCPKLPSLFNGNVRSPSITFGSVVQYSCLAGFYIQGPNRRTCQLNGQWDGSNPSCVLIKCTAPPIPQHGLLRTEGLEYGHKTSISCVVGYKLNGNAVRTCQAAQGPVGIWSGQTPTCERVSCGDPGIPKNGIRRGSTFTVDSVVSYDCQPGYKLTGDSNIVCSKLGQWSSQAPSCQACTIGTFRDSGHDVKQCLPCPIYSHTLTAASTIKTQCVCDQYYRGPPGGPCTEIMCQKMALKPNVIIKSCGNKINSTCNFACTQGHILGKDKSVRICRSDGTWSASSPACIACPMNTYKLNENKCEKCPSNTHTKKSGESKDGCICNHGYQGPGGGPCADVDECKLDNGGCEQLCQNTAGSYRCLCNRPGYGVHPNNTSKCIVEKSCPKFTPPDNSGLVCHILENTGTERCEVKCNPGYEHPDRINVFEECGPTTNWRWSYDINDAVIAPCIEQFFPGVTVESEVAYFVKQCDELSAKQKSDIKQAFIETLEEKGVCKVNGTTVCTIGEVKVRCGEVKEFFRRRRQTDYDILTIKFSLKTNATEGKDVGKMIKCKSAAECQSTVMKTKNVMLRKALVKLEIEVSAGKSANRTATGRAGGQDIQGLMLRVGSVVLQPKKMVAKEAVVECDSGFMTNANNMCVPCLAGKYATEVNGTTKCEPCPPSTYQPQPHMTSCISCPYGPLLLTKDEQSDEGLGCTSLECCGRTLDRNNMTCKSKGLWTISPLMDTWCEKNCRHIPPFCPRSHCVCKHTAIGL